MKKIITMFLIPMFLLPNFAFAGQLPVKTNTLAVESFVKNVNKGEAQLDEAAKAISIVYAEEVIGKIKESAGEITLSQAKQEIEDQVILWARDADMDPQKTLLLLITTARELNKLAAQQIPEQTPITQSSAAIEAFKIITMGDTDDSIVQISKETNLDVLNIIKKYSNIERHIAAARSKIISIKNTRSGKNPEDIFELIAIAGMTEASFTRKELKEVYEKWAARLGYEPNISSSTTWSDLDSLVKEGLLQRAGKKGKELLYQVTPKEGNAKAAVVKAFYALWNKPDNIMTVGEGKKVDKLLSIAKLVLDTQEAIDTSSDTPDAPINLIRKDQAKELENTFAEILIQIIGRRSLDTLPVKLLALASTDSKRALLAPLCLQVFERTSYLNEIQANQIVSITQKAANIICSNETIIENKVKYFKDLLQEVSDFKTLSLIKAGLLVYLDSLKSDTLHRALLKSLNEKRNDLIRKRRNVKQGTKAPQKDVVDENEMQNITNEVGTLMGQINAHKTLKLGKKMDPSKVIIIMKKDLTETVASGKSIQITSELSREYQIMKRDLNRMFNNGEGVKEAKSSNQMLALMRKYLNDGYQVVVLDDGKFISGRNFKKQITEGNMEGCCVVSPSLTGELAGNEFYFLNLNAMVLMGLGAINKNEILFKNAYKLFTGNEPEDTLMAYVKNGAVRLLGAMPRIVRLTEGQITMNSIKKLFAVAA